MDVGVVGHRRPPGVKDRGDADAGAEMLRVRGDGRHRLGRRLEQQAVERSFVLVGDVGDLGRQGEDNVEIADRQQVGLALGKPCARGRTLAPRAVPVATAVIGNPPVPAVGAGLGVTAKRSGAAMFDSRHDLELIEAQMPGVGSPVRRTGSTEDVGDLERGAHEGSTRGVLPSISAINRSSGPVTAWIVRVATLV